MQDSLQVLYELGEQLKLQVDASAVAAIQSDRLSLTQRLGVVEQGLTRQQAVLQVGQFTPATTQPCCLLYFNQGHTVSLM